MVCRNFTLSENRYNGIDNQIEYHQSFEPLYNCDTGNVNRNLIVSSLKSSFEYFSPTGMSSNPEPFLGQLNYIIVRTL